MNKIETVYEVTLADGTMMRMTRNKWLKYLEEHPEYAEYLSQDESRSNPFDNITIEQLKEEAELLKERKKFIFEPKGV
ncbi:MAG: hypothetical protein FWE53_00740 [Firmicutes bacterium]|nr:hypothetical protein [Bacillota bacterium]